MEVHSTNEMYARAQEFVERLRRGEKATVIALSGDLGSGKTTFVQGALRALGVQEHITSPTFVIQKMYEILDSRFSRVFHIDAYRLENEHELEVLGWGEIVRDPSNLIFIEWPEKVPGLVKETQHITFTYINENIRTLRYDKNI